MFPFTCGELVLEFNIVVVPAVTRGEVFNPVYKVYMGISLNKEREPKFLFRTGFRIKLTALVLPCGVFKRNGYTQHREPQIYSHKILWDTGWGLMCSKTGCDSFMLS